MASLQSSNTLPTKQAALETIGQLAQTHDISFEEISAHILKQSSDPKNSKWLTKLLGYLGAIFIFGGLALLIGIIWKDINSPARVIITYGPGLVAFILGILCVKDARYEKAATALFLKSAVLLPTGMFVFLHEYAKGDDGQLAAMLVFGILALQFLVVFISLHRTSLLFFAFLFWNGALGILMERSGVPGEILGLLMGGSILAISYHFDKTLHRAITPFWYFIGGLGLSWAVFDLINNHNFIDLLYLPFTIVLMMISTKMNSRTLLIVSTFALLGYLGYFTHRYFADVIGWPFAIILFGFVMIGISAQAVKLGQKMNKTPLSP